MPEKQSESGWLVRTSLVIIAFVAVAAALIYTRAIMVPFVLAIFIASIVSLLPGLSNVTAVIVMLL